MLSVDQWQSGFWTMLFAVAMTYPEEPKLDDKFYYKRFYEDIAHVLPKGACQCRQNYQLKLTKFPINPYLSDGREGLTRWVLKLYNDIQKSNGKPEVNLEYITGRYLKSKKKGNYLYGFLCSKLPVLFGGGDDPASTEAEAGKGEEEQMISKDRVDLKALYREYLKPLALIVVVVIAVHYLKTKYGW